MRTEQLLLVWCFLPLCFAEPVFIAYRITQVWKSTSICSLVSTQNRLFNSENREYISENRVFVCCFPLGGFVRTGFVRTNREKKQLDWLATNIDDITTQSHSLFACSRGKDAKWKTSFNKIMQFCSHSHMLCELYCMLRRVWSASICASRISKGPV